MKSFSLVEILVCSVLLTITLLLSHACVLTYMDIFEDRLRIENYNILLQKMNDENYEFEKNDIFFNKYLIRDSNGNITVEIIAPSES